MAVNRESALPRVAWLAISALVLLAYMGSLHGEFVYDDKIEVIGNRTIRTVDNWRAVIGYNLNRPLLIFTYAWNYKYFGLDPFGYHLTNLLVHVLTVGAALGMGIAVGRLFGHPRPLGAAALPVGLWAIHPMATEAVSYITGRSESLCAMFVFLSVWFCAEALLLR